MFHVIPTLPDAEARALLVALAPTALTKAYSGRPGCACGCRGDYRYTSVDDRGVARILGSARRAAKAGAHVVAYLTDGEVSTVAVETPTRLYLLSTVPCARASQGFPPSLALCAADEGDEGDEGYLALCGSDEEDEIDLDAHGFPINP